MAKFKNPCPFCGRSDFHEAGCDPEYSFEDFEAAYSGIISTLLHYNALGESTTLSKPLSKDKLEDEVSQMLKRGAWISLHDKCLSKLIELGRVQNTGDGYVLIKPEERDEVIPFFEPLSVVFEYGPIDGCKDYAVYSMISWCSLVDLDWNQTVNFMRFWMDKTGRWETESWQESTVKSLVEDKRHIFEKELGWSDYPQICKEKMERSSKSPQFDARDVADKYDRDDFDSKRGW
jgi:hypothetical protein